MNALRAFLYYVSLYLGIALIGGAIVHLPINPVRFGAIGLFGLVLFTCASYVEARRKKGAGDLGMSTARYLILSFGLSLGLGMFSGSIQHFLDVPQYAAALIPIGFCLAFVSYSLRENLLSISRNTVTIAAVFAGMLAVYWGLHEFSHLLDGHGGHAHSH